MVHRYLRAIGFSEMISRKQVQELIRETIHHPTESDDCYVMDSDGLWRWKDPAREGIISKTGFDLPVTEKGIRKKERSMEPKAGFIALDYKRLYAPGIGLCVCGEREEELGEEYAEFREEFCFPFLLPEDVSVVDEVHVERHLADGSFAGICDDSRLGVSLIFYLQNRIPYLKMRTGADMMRPYSRSLFLPSEREEKPDLDESNKPGDFLHHCKTEVSLSALSIEGSIFMPIQKTPQEKRKLRKRALNRYHMIMKAKKGNESAIESLTLSDMDTYANITNQLKTNDVLSLVDSFFMPNGAECDLYTVLGEIEQHKRVVNEKTGEILHLMKILCNDLRFNLCINELDLMGEPAIGRRFKGNIWLQGVLKQEGFSVV